jgi:hypothetical protein
VLLWITLGISWPETHYALLVRSTQTAVFIVFHLNHGRQDMECPICGAIAERIATTIDSVGIACPMCGEFDVASSVVASGQLQGLALHERSDVLGRAQRSAEPGGRPLITPYLLA